MKTKTTALLLSLVLSFELLAQRSVADYQPKTLTFRFNVVEAPAAAAPDNNGGSNEGNR